MDRVLGQKFKYFNECYSYTKRFPSLGQHLQRDETILNKINQLSTPYQMDRCPYLLTGELNFAFLMNPFMMSMLAKADFLNVDVTFTDNKEFP